MNTPATDRRQVLYALGGSASVRLELLEKAGHGLSRVLHGLSSAGGAR